MDFDNEISKESEMVQKKKSIWPIIEGIILTFVLAYFNADLSVIVLLWITNIVFILEERIENKISNLFLKVVSVILSIMLLSSFYNLYLDNKYENIVKSEKYYAATYEEIFDDFSTYTRWECVGNERFTALDYNKSERYNGGFIGVVTVSGDCFIYDKETEYTLTFYISENDNDVIPVELEIGGQDYSDNINAFLLTAYNECNEDYIFE